MELLLAASNPHAESTYLAMLVLRGSACLGEGGSGGACLGEGGSGGACLGEGGSGPVSPWDGRGDMTTAAMLLGLLEAHPPAPITRPTAASTPATPSAASSLRPLPMRLPVPGPVCLPPSARLVALEALGEVLGRALGNRRPKVWPAIDEGVSSQVKSSPVQSSPVQSSPVQPVRGGQVESSPVQPARGGWWRGRSCCSDR